MAAKLEVCAGSIESIRAAYEGGAYRVELCSALSEDGLTPSLGMIRYALSLEGLRVHVLIRPRSGNFVYSPEELSCMEEDIRIAREAGVHGVVIGALTPEGDVDTQACRSLIRAAGDMDITFHRAFDVTRDPLEAFEAVMELGCSRLLTSGHAPSAEEGLPLLKRLVEIGNGRICVMPGAGVTPENAARILKESGASEIHASARSSRVFGRTETDPEIVEKIVASI